MSYHFRKFLNKANIAVVRPSTLKDLEDKALSHHDLQIISNFSEDNYLELYKKSKAQLRQDLFVLHQLNYKKNGYFVEFGATNGIDFSNTFLLEKEFDWTGIVAEPARVWEEDLRKNRNCFIETLCVWKNSDSEMFFTETKSPELSSLKLFQNNDRHRDSRRDGIDYQVQTISLLDLLQKHNAPKVIDYLSIDTEGSEFDILNAFDFSKYRFRVISCEHNFTNKREKVRSLLLKNGYKQVYEELSMYDDWFVLSEN